MAIGTEHGVDALLSDAAGLPSGPCKTCEREVLAHLVVAEAAAPSDAATAAGEPAETWVCVHCGTTLRRIVWVDEHDLARLGYALSDPTVQKACGTGCGRGCGVK